LPGEIFKEGSMGQYNKWQVFTAFLALFATLAVAFDAVAQNARTITGAGATFPYPVYATWAVAYKAKTGITVDYQAVGSGQGLERLKARAVNFGASDMPLKPDELERAGMIQFPAIVGGDVPVVNLTGIKPGELKLTGPVLADIYLGKISKWNDPALVALNRDLKLPDIPVTVVYRSDESGTTFIWVNYLSKVSPEWRARIGEGTTVAWPVGVGQKGNEGVAEHVRKIQGAIGYVEYTYALERRLVDARVQNRYGVFVTADINGFRAAAANAEWSGTPGFYLLLTDQLGRNAWPITGASFILMHRTQQDATNARSVLEFFDFVYRDGGPAAIELHYSPLPMAALGSIRAAWKQLKDAAGKPVWN